VEGDMEEIQIVARAVSYADAVALRNGKNEWTYSELVVRSASLARTLLVDADDMHEARVACLVPPGFDYISTQWGTWRAGGVTVPLSLSATEPELEYALTDSGAECVVVDGMFADRTELLCERLGLRCLITSEESRGSGEQKALPLIDVKRRAMILYTSGTTSKPKGVVSTHANIESQIETLVDAWQWQSNDTIPLFLPLHHIHGIINVMSCALWSGAVIEPFSSFEIEAILERVAAGAYSVFMAVPTIYVRLIQYLESMADGERDRVIAGFKQMRLMISGSAALPASVHETWTSLTCQALLERYGMTEIGMGLSNPYDGERRPGAVGRPLPGVEIRLKSENGDLVNTEGQPGEIEVRGPGVFLEYFNRPDVTAAAFDNGWFRTGDMAVVEDGYYRIMGRLSVDIIKSGGYKLSALEIEAALLQHASICECAVVGVADDTGGETVVAAVVLAETQELTLDELRLWCRDRISKYKMPTQLLVVENLPRNAMGKVTKPAVRDLF
jgi:malonyl-CoA/methylmalonyl-CoA synthetase